MTLFSITIYDTDPLIGDYNALAKLEIDWAPIPATVRGKQLESVQIRTQEGGAFLNEVIVGQANASRRHVCPPQRWHAHPVINYVAWRWFIERCEIVSASKVHQYTVELSDALTQLNVAKNASESVFEKAIRGWARDVFLHSPNTDAGHHRQTALRQFLATGQLESEWGFSDEVASCLLGMKINNRITRGIHVLTLDDVNGPFTQAQRVAIDRFLESRVLNTFDEALLRLHRYIGLRPTQTALLRECDLTEKDGRWHLVIHLIKGKHSTGRRNPNNIRQYKIPDDVAIVLQRLINEEQDNPLTCPLTNIDTTCPTKRPMFKAVRTNDRTLPKDARDAQYYYHLSPQLVSERFYMMSKNHVITTKETDLRTNKKVIKPVRITAYRFRYSVGTHLAQKGASLRQIAVWLGHKGEESVRFYIKMAQEWWDHDFSLSSSPIQQKAIAALSGALVDKLPKSEDGQIAACIAMTGTCVLPPGVPECPYDPMKSCATCSNRRDTSEMTDDTRWLVAQAIKTNQDEFEFWQANSTAQFPLGMLTERERLVDAAEILAEAWEVAS
ncbi:tyrosine-type recombinase/integrase [Neptunomonas qingdaonensis]|uniref:Phage integrase family protein n=1 Tax=Neptunomonas qingdaonensis TaxID=1045558 RepID=A0A1I2R9J0_9GAMM|nr:tyrosine-type recombinase/integrase [Neptunomonas qingdaonensis]SFG37122.1 Phage integrase family protein [Neptunomonas qingdaonensis]